MDCVHAVSPDLITLAGRNYHRLDSISHHRISWVTFKLSVETLVRRNNLYNSFRCKRGDINKTSIVIAIVCSGFTSYGDQPDCWSYVPSSRLCIRLKYTGLPAYDRSWAVRWWRGTELLNESWFWFQRRKKLSLCGFHIRLELLLHFTRVHRVVWKFMNGEPVSASSFNVWDSIVRMIARWRASVPNLWFRNFAARLLSGFQKKPFWWLRKACYVVEYTAK